MRLVLLLVLLSGFLQGCTCDQCGDFFVRQTYFLQTSPPNVLRNLQISYLKREIPHYEDLLADDFRFYFSPEARQRNPELPEYWTKEEDVARTKALFESPEVTDIRISLQFGNPRPVTEPGRETWQRIDVPDTFLEVDLAPKAGEPEGLTLRVDQQKQEFFFRKGRTPQTADSLIFFIVEWHDLGSVPDTSSVPGNSVQTTTWSSIKLSQP